MNIRNGDLGNGDMTENGQDALVGLMLVVGSGARAELLPKGFLILGKDIPKQWRGLYGGALLHLLVALKTIEKSLADSIARKPQISFGDIYMEPLSFRHVECSFHTWRLGFLIGDAVVKMQYSQHRGCALGNRLI